MAEEGGQKLDIKVLDFRKIAFSFIEKWKWYVLAFAISVFLGALLYISIVPEFKVTSALLLGNQHKVGFGQYAEQIDPSQNFENRPLDQEKNYWNEINILKSYSNIKENILKMDLEVYYYKKEFLKEPRKYMNIPFKVVFDKSQYQPLGVRFVIHKNGSKYQLEVEAEEVTLYCFETEDKRPQKVSFNIYADIVSGDQIVSDYFDFAIQDQETDQADPHYYDGTYYFEFRSYDYTALDFKNKMVIKPAPDESSLLTFNMVTDLPSLGVEFLNQVMKDCVESDLDRKNKVAEKTIDFIDDQLKDLSIDLDTTERNLQQYQSENQLLDVSFQQKKIYEKLQFFNKKQSYQEMRMRYFRYLENYIEHSDLTETIVSPSSVGIEDALLTALVVSIKVTSDQLVSVKSSPIVSKMQVKRLQDKLENSRAGLLENIKGLIVSSQMELDKLNAEVNQALDEGRELPLLEKDLMGMKRVYEVKSKIYSLLLERKTAATITKGSNVSNNEVIDPARLEVPFPVSPKKSSFGILIIFLTFSIPTGIFFFLNLVNSPVSDEEDILALGHKYPMITVQGMKSQQFVSSKVLSKIKQLQFEIEYQLRNIRSPLLTISSFDKKSCAERDLAYMAIAFSESQKKVLIIDTKNEGSKLKKYFSQYRNEGLNDFLCQYVGLNQILNKSSEYLSVIFAGTKVDQSQFHLLKSVSMQLLLEQARREYDIVIISAPSVGSCPESYYLASISDKFILDVSRGITNKHVMERELLELKKYIDLSEIEYIFQYKH